MSVRIAWSCCLAGALLIALATAMRASAAPAPPWYDAGAGAPASVDFSAVAAYRAASGDDVVVAVGRDTQLKQAVIYRRAGGVWTEDAIAGSLNAVDYDSCLTGIAVTAQAAWAVGSQGGGCGGSSGGHALIVAFPGGGEALATPGDTAASNAWQIVTSTLGPLSAISLSGEDGYLTSAANAIYPLHGAGTPPADLGSPAPLSATPSTASVAGIGAYSAAGFAVGDSSPSGVHIYSLGSDATAANSLPDAGAQPLVRVAALGTSAAIAVEGAGACPGSSNLSYWFPSGGVWRRSSDAFEAGWEPRAAAIAGSATSATEAVAGSAPADGGCQGAIWYRTAADPTANGGWQHVDGLGPALTGVAVVNRYDIWAAGDQGSVLQFYDPPPPPWTGSTPASPPPSATPAAGTSTGSGAHTATAPAPHVVIDQPRPTRTRGHGHHGKRVPLLGHVKVVVERGRLVVSFTLSKRARVRIEPRTGGRLVGAVRARVYPAGRSRVVIRYRGSRPPAQLRIVARPAKRGSCSRRTAPSRGGRHAGRKGGGCAQNKTH